MPLQDGYGFTEQAQDDVIDLLRVKLPDELLALEQRKDHSGQPWGPLIPLQPPKAYFNLMNPTIDAQMWNAMPSISIEPNLTRIDENASSGQIIRNGHSLAAVIFVMHQNPDTLQRMRSRYAEAVVRVLKRNQQCGCLERIDVGDVLYDRAYPRKGSSSFFAPVFVAFRAYTRTAIPFE